MRGDVYPFAGGGAHAAKTLFGLHCRYKYLAASIAGEQAARSMWDLGLVKSGGCFQVLGVAHLVGRAAALVVRSRRVRGRSDGRPRSGGGR